MSDQRMRDLGPIASWEYACSNWKALVFAIPAGGAVPIAVYFEAHALKNEVGWAFHWEWLLVFGALLYSAKKVWTWMHSINQDPVLATGFVLIMEGVLICQRVEWLSKLVLVLLVAINWVASASALAQRHIADKELMTPSEPPEAAPDTPEVRTSPPAGAFEEKHQSLHRLNPQEVSEAARERPEEPRDTTPPRALPAPRCVPALPSQEAGSCGDGTYLAALRYLRAGHVEETSISALKSALGVGHAKAQAAVETLSRDGVVGEAGPKGKRPVLLLELERRYRALGDEPSRGDIRSGA